MKKLNFLVNNLGATQLSYYLITALNELQEERRDIDTIVFYNTLHMHSMLPNFSCMQMIEAIGQDGVMVATSLPTASQLLSFSHISKKYYYIWDLPWMRIVPRIYQTTRRVITDPSLRLLVRSKSHLRAVENAYNVQVYGVIDNFYKDDIVRLIDE